MTTNRISSIDHAFQSRIDLFLPYFNLQPQVRRKVWSNFINHHGREKFDITEWDLDRLADLALNGREIKNLIKTAQLLSYKTGGKVTSDKLYMLSEKREKALRMLE